MSRENRVKMLKSYFLITLGSLLVAVGIELFFIPHKIAPGGVTGLSLVINNFFPAISIATYVIIFNIILFILAFKLLGGGFGIKTLYASFSLSTFMWVIENLIKPEVISSDLMLNAMIGILLLGTGLGIVFNQDASTGGTDILAKIVNKYFHISMGLSMTMIDFLVVVLVALIFGLERGLYATLATFLNGIVINRVVEGFNEKKQVFVITSEKEKVKQFIVKEIERGATIFSGEGGFSGGNNYVIYSVVSTKEFVRLKTYLRENIPDAFVTVSNTSEVLGQGFSIPRKNSMNS